MNIILTVSNKLAVNINMHLKKEAEEFEKLKYGMAVLFINISKITSLFLFAYLLGIFKYTFLFFLCFSFVRSFAFGVHAEKSFYCTLSNFVIFIGGVYVSKMVNLSIWQSIIMFIISFILLAFYAPADTKARPIVGKKLRRKLKIKSLLTSLLLMVMMVIFRDYTYKNIITFAVFSEALCIIPFTYKIFNKEYNNYVKLIC